jgi:hypothetical protein
MSVTDDEAQIETRRVQEGLAQERSTFLVPPVEVVDIEDEPSSLRDEGQKLTQGRGSHAPLLAGIAIIGPSDLLADPIDFGDPPEDGEHP